jgi:hypothetical protein
MASAVLDKVKEDRVRVRMQNELDRMSAAAFYMLAKYDKAAETVGQCFGNPSGEQFMSLFCSARSRGQCYET